VDATPPDPTPKPAPPVGPSPAPRTMPDAADAEPFAPDAVADALNELDAQAAAHPAAPYDIRYERGPSGHRINKNSGNRTKNANRAGRLSAGGKHHPTPEIVTRLITSWKKLAPILTAVRAAGIRTDTFKRWLEKGQMADELHQRGAKLNPRQEIYKILFEGWACAACSGKERIFHAYFDNIDVDPRLGKELLALRFPKQYGHLISRRQMDSVGVDVGGSQPATVARFYYPPEGEPMPPPASPPVAVDRRAEHATAAFGAEGGPLW
jgi:hypothetical protein